MIRPGSGQHYPWAFVTPGHTLLVWYYDATGCDNVLGFMMETNEPESDPAETTPAKASSDLTSPGSPDGLYDGILFPLSNHDVEPGRVKVGQTPIELDQHATDSGSSYPVSQKRYSSMYGL